MPTDFPRTIHFPESHLKRAAALKPIFRVSFSQIVRDGTEKHLRDLEERAEQDQRRYTTVAKQPTKDSRKPSRGIRGSLAQNLAPSTMTPATRAASRLERLIAPEPVTAQTHDADDELYERAARALLGSSMEPKDVRRRAEAAVNMVRKERSLTAPSESEILERLEENYRRIKNAPIAEVRSYDTFVGTIVDLDKVKTAGEPIE